MASGAPISFASMAQKDQRKLPLRSVQLEGQVLLKIAQHCASASLNTVLTGQLLGLDVGQTLEVTDCFPFPVSVRNGCQHWELVGCTTQIIKRSSFNFDAYVQ